MEAIRSVDVYVVGAVTGPSAVHTNSMVLSINATARPLSLLISTFPFLLFYYFFVSLQLHLFLIYSARHVSHYAPSLLLYHNFAFNYIFKLNFGTCQITRSGFGCEDILIYMATLGARSMLLSHHEGTGISNVCIKLGLNVTSTLRFHRRREFQCPNVVVLKLNVLSSTRKPPRHLLRPYRYYCSLGSRWPQHHKWKRDSSSNSTPTIPRIFKFALDRMPGFLKDWSHLRFMEVAGILVCILMIVPSADAVDALKTCACLLKECRIELARCLSNPSCAANIACLQTCNNRPDETECQIKCGDLFENKVVDEFNECAVSRKKCVPQKSDVGDFPVPNPDVLVKSFNISDFSGKWYITSGLNPTFDTFDCQIHEFHTESDKLVANLSWRVGTPDAGFFSRSTVQRFVQDPSYPGILYNHDNEYLHYQDDWYILSSKIDNKPDDYIFVYYRGRNDAWDGYGGAVVYTRSAVLPESIIPELEKAAKSVGRDFGKFIRTDNTCGPEPSLVERLEKKVEEGEETIVREVEQLEGEVEKVGKTEMSLFQRLAEGFKVLQEDEENFLRGLSKEEMEILDGLKMEADEVEKLFGSSLPLRKLR